jgi:hypothetical protein
MRGIAIGALWALLCACTDDAPKGDLSNPRPLDEKVRNAPPVHSPPQVVKAAPPPDAGPSAVEIREAYLRDWKPWNDTPNPDPAKLTGALELSSGSTNGMSMFQSSSTIKGDATGATVVIAEECRRCGPSDRGYFRGKLPADKAKVLIASLKQLRFWALNDGLEMAITDATHTTVHVKLGEVTRDVSIGSGCKCMNHRPTEASPDSCECPQQQLYGLLYNARKDAAAAVLPKVKVATFAPPRPKKSVKAKGSCTGSAKEGYSCRASIEGKPLEPHRGTGVSRWAELPWCQLKTPTVYSCFESPFETTEVLVDVGLPLDEKFAALYHREPEARAVSLGSGEHCVYSLREWKCDKGTTVNGVLPAGTTWVALGDGGKELPLSAVYLR